MNYKYFIFTFFCIAAACSQLHAHDRETGYPESAGDTLAMGVASRYESRYFSEGRDALDGEPLWVNSIDIAYGILGAELWYGQSPDSEYDELQLTLAATQTFGEIEVTMGFTLFEFPFEDASDEEVGIGLVIPDLPMKVEFALDAYYSFEAEGYFVELTLTREVISNERFSAGAVAILGNNQGYVSDGHDGANHFALGVEAALPMGETLAITLHVARSWALGRDAGLDGDQQLVDFLHGSVGMRLEF